MLLAVIEDKKKKLYCHYKNIYEKLLLRNKALIGSVPKQYASD